MKKPPMILVDPRWIGEDFAFVNSKDGGGCEFHMREDGSGRWCKGCGCCNLVRAYIKWKKKQKDPRLPGRPVKIFEMG